MVDGWLEREELWPELLVDDSLSLDGGLLVDDLAATSIFELGQPAERQLSPHEAGDRGEVGRNHNFDTVNSSLANKGINLSDVIDNSALPGPKPGLEPDFGFEDNVFDESTAFSSESNEDLETDSGHLDFHLLDNPIDLPPVLNNQVGEQQNMIEAQPMVEPGLSSQMDYNNLVSLATEAVYNRLLGELREGIAGGSGVLY